MGASVASCQKYWGDPWSEDLRDPIYDRAPALLRVDVATIRESMGAALSPFCLTDEVVIEAVEKAMGFEPLSWRQARCSQQRTDAQALTWPQGSRWVSPQLYYRVRINRRWFLLQVAANPEHRTMEHIKAVVEDSKDVAAYAHRFNSELTRMQGAGADFESGMHDDDSVPHVKVCAPVGCSVLRPGMLSNLVGPGNFVVLTPYPAVEIRKFVFDGTEDFLELPQAFFHYVAWLSGGGEFVYDLQGFEGDDGDIFLTDPCIMKAARPTIATMFAPVVDPLDVSGQQQLRDTGPSQERFDMLHPRCGQLCKGFDPQRKGVKARHVCGMGVKGACGLGRA